LFARMCAAGQGISQRLNAISREKLDGPPRRD
jgi:hypothetical protein